MMYTTRMKKVLILSVLAFLLFGCAHIISQELREQTDKEIANGMIFKNPDAYTGRTVILGGVIVSAQNTKNGTYIEVLQKPLDYRGRPKDTDISHGRFIIFYDEYLETVIFSTGKEITVGGKVLGKTTRPLGEIQYTYPLIHALEIHLFRPQNTFPLFFSIGVFSDF